MATIYNPNIVTDKLVFCLDAANTKSYPGSGTDWKDLSSQGNNGTLTNSPTYVPNSNGGYFDFDGTNDYINANTALPDSFFLGNSTISFWIYFKLISNIRSHC